MVNEPGEADATRETGPGRSASTERPESPARQLPCRGPLDHRETERSRSRRWLIGRTRAWVATGTLTLLAAGCAGGSKAPTVASLGTTTSTASASQPSAPSGGSFVPFVNCMNSHGITASTGPGGHGVSVDVDPNSPQFQTAQRACQKLMPGGLPPALTPAQVAERATGLATFAACMRKHGVRNFPDPTGQVEFPIGKIAQLDTTSTFFRSADKSCQPLFPRIGPQMRFG